MFAAGKIDEDTVDCPRFFAFKGASREDSSSSFNLGQLAKRIHNESDGFDEEEALQAQRKDRRRPAPFFFGDAKRVHIHLKPTSMCGIDVVRRRGGGGGGHVYKSRPDVNCLSFNYPCTSRGRVYFNTCIGTWPLTAMSISNAYAPDETQVYAYSHYNENPDER